MARLSHKRILLVEDSFSTRELLSMILGCHGYRVATAENGARALEKLRDHEPPDVILLDLSMPVMDGWELAEQLERDPRLADVPVIVVSGMAGAVEAAARLEFAPILSKPVETADLLHTVACCCRRERVAI